MNITVTEYSGYSSFTCNSWVAEKCLGRKTNFYVLYLNFCSLYLKFFLIFICEFLSFSLICNCSSFDTVFYLLVVTSFVSDFFSRLHLAFSLGFTRLFQLLRELTFDLHGFRTRIPTHWWFTLRSCYHSTIQASDGYLTNGANKPRHNDEHWSVSPVTQVLKPTLA